MEREHFTAEIRRGQFARVGTEIVAERQIREFETVLFAGRVDRAAVGAEERGLDGAEFVIDDTAFMHAARGDEGEALLAIADRLDVKERFFSQFHLRPVASFGIDGDGAFREIIRMMGKPCLRVFRSGRAEDAEAVVFDRVVDGRFDFDRLRMVAQCHKRHDEKVFACIRTMLRVPVVAFRKVHLGLDAERDALRAVMNDGNLAGRASREGDFIGHRLPVEPTVTDFGAVFEGEQIMIDIARRLVEQRERSVGFDGNFEEFVRGGVGGRAERADGAMEHRGGFDEEGIEAKGGQVDIDGDRVALSSLRIFAPAEGEILRPFAEFGLDVKYLVFKWFAVAILQQEGVVELRAEGVMEFRRPVVGEVDGDDDGSLAALRQRIGDGDGEFVWLLRQIFAEGGEIAE